jgi:hypothetical protein
MEELQLQDLQNIDAIGLKSQRSETSGTEVRMHRPAVEVQKNARPARQDDPTVPTMPVSGRESKRPIDD